MPNVTTLPGAHTPRNDYLAIALVLSVAIHGALLALRFATPQRPPAQPRNLEVTLVNARSERMPLQPKVLAQQQLDGGGEVEEGYAASPLPRTANQTPDEIVLAALRRRQAQLEAEQRRLYTRLLAREQVLSARRRPDSQGQSGEQGEDERDQESAVINARISAIKDRIDRYNARPRRQFVGPSAARVDYAAYVEAWRKKIELIGTQHYPQEARGKVYGSLRITVYIRSDGTLDHFDIERPSQHAILNLAASRIVQLAAPFAPLPPSIAHEAQILAITRTWNFVNQQLEANSP
ncbi:TonB family protein [Allopusillimonas soli]|uniref:TonB family protein n=1 Tax=Allopusillimonas soli TaxID=659016 RepID=A0A853F882_9BURK|nr:TonB family protein [Allopusillimonas soli]NYT36169.1 TonB family protein [Allopusillimonas soli]TEA76502.1 TonB family protein [Allopusillimonas soli]